MKALDLTQVPVVDNHCHGISQDQTFEDLASWRRAFTESTDPGMPRDHVASTIFYRRLIRTLADFLGCEPEEEAVFAARTGWDERGLTGALLRAANVDTLLLDTGFPPFEEVLPVAELSELGGCRAEPMLRLEILMEDFLEAVKATGRWELFMNAAGQGGGGIATRRSAGDIVRDLAAGAEAAMERLLK